MYIILVSKSDIIRKGSQILVCIRSRGEEDLEWECENGEE